MHDDIIHKRWRELKWDGLSIDEQGYIMLWWLVSEVINGTFDQYFANETGDHAFVALEFCERNKLDVPRNIIHRAIRSLIPYGGYKSNWAERRVTMLEFWKSPENEQEGIIGPLSNEIRENCEEFMGRASELVIQKLRDDMPI